MNDKTLLHQIRRGLGSAIIELAEHSEHNSCRDIVLKCCLKSITVDTQSEGTKGYYLYTAICALGAQDEFEPVLINAFNKRLEHSLFLQLVDILYFYAVNGSKKACDALLDKYHALIIQLSKQRSLPFRYCEREQFEHLMINLVDMGRWPTFKQCIHDAGAILLARRDDVCNCYDWFLNHCTNLFGKKRVFNYLENESSKSAQVKAFLDAYGDLEKIREENALTRIEPAGTLESYIQHARTLEKEQYSYARMYRTSKSLVRQASNEDLISLAKHISLEPSDEIKANLLRAFVSVDYTGDVRDLLEYAVSDCEKLRDVSLYALGRLKDERIHDLAATLIGKGNLDDGLPLLLNNWHTLDEVLIRKPILKSRTVSHSLQKSIRDIFAKRRSNTCGDILEHVYRNGECAYCRFGIVEGMVNNHVLNKVTLHECMYDSYDDTRTLAKRILAKG